MHIAGTLHEQHAPFLIIPRHLWCQDAPRGRGTAHPTSERTFWHTRSHSAPRMPHRHAAVNTRRASVRCSARPVQHSRPCAHGRQSSACQTWQARSQHGRTLTSRRRCALARRLRVVRSQAAAGLLNTRPFRREAVAAEYVLSQMRAATVSQHDKLPQVCLLASMRRPETCLGPHITPRPLIAPVLQDPPSLDPRCL